MLPVSENYAIFPSVIPADTPTEMVIVAREKAFLPSDGEAYDLTVIPVGGDEPNYYAPSTHIKLTAVAKDGVLRFTHTFSDEQEHLIFLEYGEKKLWEFHVFSLREDLYALRPLIGDLHAHSFRSDGKRDPAALAGHFREQGYDFFALTDHNRYYPGGEIDETYQNVRLGITHIQGEEVHTPGSIVHIVHIGGKRSVTERYVHDQETHAREIADYAKRVPDTIPAQYAERYAKAMWATDKIHAAGGLAIFPHPFWIPVKSHVFNVCDEFARILLTSGMFDAFELLGGGGQAIRNRTVAFWGDLRAEGLKIPVVGSSDVHDIEKDDTFPHVFTVCFAKENEESAILSAVRDGNSVAVEATGTEYDRHYRAYGSLRLVTYVQYLLRHFFPKRQRICQGEGVAMRAFAIGETDAALIEAQVAQSERFYASFFGKEAPMLPTRQILDFEERWRDTQRNGPLTKGGSIQAPPVTRQI